jgi:hypothetical protein
MEDSAMPLVKRELRRTTIYLPPEQWTWIAEQAERNYTTITGEVVRIIRERRERMEAEQSAAG